MMASPSTTTRGIAKMRKVYFTKYILDYPVNCRHVSTSNKHLAMPVIAHEDVYLDKPRYPEIRDTSREAKIKYKRLDRYEEIKNMKTVAEKMLAVSTAERQRFILFPGYVNRYGATDFVQHITKTHLVSGLPDRYKNMDVTSLLAQLKQPILDAVVSENEKNEWTLPKWKKQDGVVDLIPEKAILNAILNHLMSTQEPHLLSAQVTEKPRCNAFWWRGNDQTDLLKAVVAKKSRYQVPTFQVEWSPDFIIRMPNPLPPILNRDDPVCASNEVPYCPYYPSNYSLIWTTEKRFLTCTPGFWPGDNWEFPYLSLMSSSPILNYWRTLYGEHDIDDAVHQAAMVCSFGWLLASATIQGFTQYNELTYPLVAQSIYSNGKTWSFYIYQMNTLALHPDVDEQTHRNICWTSGPLDLYETIEDGQIKGLNEDVLKTLIQFFHSKPQIMQGIDLKPYLDGPEVEEQLNLMKERYTNRPDCLVYVNEVPTWQHVYKFNPEAPLSPHIKLW